MITLGLDVLESVVFRRRAGFEASTLWFDLAVAPLYVAALAMVLAATFDADPRVLTSRRLRARRPQEWARVRAAVPLLAGTLAAYFATTWWEFQLVAGEGIEPEFFAQMSQVIALLLVALCIEVGFYRTAVTDPTQRPMAVLAVSVLCVGEVMALSALTKKGDEIYGWHMYGSFIATVEACLVAFATLTWVLIIRRPAEAAVEPAPAPLVAGSARPAGRAPVGEASRTVAVGCGLGFAAALLVWRTCGAGGDRTSRLATWSVPATLDRRPTGSTGQLVHVPAEGPAPGRRSAGGGKRGRARRGLRRAA
ncbi:hypothetical protein [Saccharothrix sp.]|uniref:hypothetical protein n=1 Tax=Saccharothrix sp. TaxID=1873460 RepID=UPI002812180B|nr:hypothetical protein [Saccharothrix sp.]